MPHMPMLVLKLERGAWAIGPQPSREVVCEATLKPSHKCTLIEDLLSALCLMSAIMVSLGTKLQNKTALTRDSKSYLTQCNIWEADFADLPRSRPK